MFCTCGCKKKVKKHGFIVIPYKLIVCGQAVALAADCPAGTEEFEAVGEFGLWIHPATTRIAARRKTRHTRLFLMVIILA
jgi:hypothetical protein